MSCLIWASPLRQVHGHAMPCGAGLAPWRPVAGDATGKSDALAGRAGLRDGRPCRAMPAAGGSYRVRAISSTSQRAITLRSEGKPGMIRFRRRHELPSDRSVIGLRQVDEMALGPAVWSERIRSAPSGSRRHSAARDGMTPQIRGHSPAWPGLSRDAPSAFRTKEVAGSNPVTPTSQNSSAAQGAREPTRRKRQPIIEDSTRKWLTEQRYFRWG